MPTVPVSFRLDQRLADELKVRSSAAGRTFSGELTMAITRYVDGEMDDDLAEIKQRIGRLEQMAGLD